MQIHSIKDKTNLALMVALGLMVSVAAPAAAEEASEPEQPQASEGDGSLDRELEQYWATERELDSIRDRLFERDGRFGAGVYVGLLSSEPFFHYFPVGARLTYHFSNALGVEIGGAYMGADLLYRHTELTRVVLDEYDDGTGNSTFDPATDTEDRFLWRTNATVVWSPLYGKVAALQKKMIHFDLNFAAGLGVVGVERPDSQRNGADSAVAPEFVIGAGTHFYLGESVVLRMDGRGYLYQGAELPIHQENPQDPDESTTGRMKFPMEFNLGITYLF